MDWVVSPLLERGVWRPRSVAAGMKLGMRAHALKRARRGTRMGIVEGRLYSGEYGAEAPSLTRLRVRRVATDIRLTPPGGGADAAVEPWSFEPGRSIHPLPPSVKIHVLLMLRVCDILSAGP